MGALIVSVNGQVHATIGTEQGRSTSVDIVRVIHAEDAVCELPARDSVALESRSFGESGNDEVWSWPGRELSVGDKVTVTYTVSADPTPPTVRKMSTTVRPEKTLPEAFEMIREAISYIPEGSDADYDALRTRLRDLLTRHSGLEQS